MGLLNLKGFEADAEVLGMVRAVVFAGGRLTIGSGELRREDAEQIVAALERGAVITVQLPAARSTATPDDKRGDAWEPPFTGPTKPPAPVGASTPTAPLPTPSSAPAVAPPAPPAQVAAPVVAPEVARVDTGVPLAPEADPFTPPAAPPAAPPAPPPSAPVEAPPPPAEAYPSEVVRAQTLRPVVGWLGEAKGIRELPAMIAAVRALAPVIAVVQKIITTENDKLDARIEKTMTTLGWL